MSQSLVGEFFDSDYLLKKYSKEILELRAQLWNFSSHHKKSTNYKTADSAKISDISNKLRYLIEQYCFHINILQDLIQISIPIDPFVDVLDIFPSDELPISKQQNLLELLSFETSNEISHKSVFNEYDIKWFNFMIERLNFITENYNFLTHWETDYNSKIMEKLDQQNQSLSKPSNENKLFKAYIAFKDEVEKDLETFDLKEQSTKKKDASDKVHALTFKDKLKEKNKNITKSLVRSNQILKSTVLQTELHLEEIYIQGNLLTDLNDKFDILDTLLSQSSKLMKILEQNGSKEKRQVYYSLAFLLACISWVVWKRLIKGPLKLLIWLWFNLFKRVLFMTGIVKRSTITVGEPIKNVLSSEIAASSSSVIFTMSSAISTISSVIFPASSESSLTLTMNASTMLTSATMIEIATTIDSTLNQTTVSTVTEGIFAKINESAVLAAELAIIDS
ncbi:hypothetical protein QEN19_000187 [Hanseniaspora menglaensis]